MPAQDPKHAAHIRHAAELPHLERKVAFYTEEHTLNPNDDKIAEALGKAREAHEHTTKRLAFAQQAAKVLDTFGLSHEITPDKITYNDALNFVAKVMHEVANGVKESHYARVFTVRDESGAVRGQRHPHKDPIKGESEEDKANREKRHEEHLARMSAPFDPVADVVEHLGLTDPAQIAAIKTLFAQGVTA